MVATNSFAQRVSRVRRVRRKQPPLEAKAANSASHFAEKGTEKWYSLYEAKLLQYKVDEKLSKLTDSADSIRLNKK